jgi:tRNA-dihydrouridine synthase A
MAGTTPLDAVMLGRAAYQTPAILRDVDRLFFGSVDAPVTFDAIIDAMMAYTERHLAQGGRVHHVTRHMIGLFQGRKGARRWRQILSSEAVRDDADETLIAKAYEHVTLSGEADILQPVAAL